MACDDRTSRRAQRWPRRAKSVQRVRVRTWRGRNRAILRTLGGSVERRRRPRFGAWFSRPACDPSARSRPRPCLLSSLSLPVPRPGMAGALSAVSLGADTGLHTTSAVRGEIIFIPRRSRSSAPSSRRAGWSWRPRPGARARPRNACITASHTNPCRVLHSEVPSGRPARRRGQPRRDRPPGSSPAEYSARPAFTAEGGLGPGRSRPSPGTGDAIAVDGTSGTGAPALREKRPSAVTSTSGRSRLRASMMRSM